LVGAGLIAYNLGWDQKFAQALRNIQLQNGANAVQVKA